MHIVHIGCARAVFQRSSDAQVSYREHVICNYGPSGNIPNQPVYLIGIPCSACQEGTSCTLDYPSLCGGKITFIDVFHKKKNCYIKYYHLLRRIDK